MEVYKEWLEKAIFIKRFGILVKVHDLVKLAAKLRCPKPVLEICNNLNPYYIGTRYPIGKKYTKEIAEEAIKNGEKVIEWVEKNLWK